MHKSRLAGLIIDCKTVNLDEEAAFWAHALGAPAKHAADLRESPYVELAMPDGEPYVEIQKVDHESRVHLDIETDNIDAEVSRLESLGATKIGVIKKWCVMQAPAGQRFCVVPVVTDDFAETAHSWAD